MLMSRDLNRQLDLSLANLTSGFFVNFSSVTEMSVSLRFLQGLMTSRLIVIHISDFPVPHGLLDGLSSLQNLCGCMACWQHVTGFAVLFSWTAPALPYLSRLSFSLPCRACARCLAALFLSFVTCRSLCSGCNQSAFTPENLQQGNLVLESLFDNILSLRALMPRSFIGTTMLVFYNGPVKDMWRIDFMWGCRTPCTHD